ncbi:MAG: TauD/TfdA family dioxygenase [Acidimicrobiales bacterium]|nr:TauD/TfdA family dioxygenase [Acidimicrobiales bacterium]
MGLLNVDVPAENLWRGADLDGTDPIAVDLPPADLTDLEAAAVDLASRGVDPVETSAADLPLGALAPLVDDLRHEVLHGRGIALLRGFPVDHRNVEEIALMFWAIGLRLGRAVSQSVMGERLGHVVDVTDVDPHARAYRNRSELAPHSDPGDLVSFLCIRAAAEGGVSRFVSSLTVFDEIRRSRPDLLEVLARGFHYHRFGEHGPDDDPVTPHHIPVFSEREGLVSGRYVPEYVQIAADEDPSIQLSDLDLEALELLHTTTNRRDLVLDFTLAAGDAVVANNFTVFHARTGFVNGPGQRRHLLRLWLAAEPPRPVVPDTKHYPGEPGIPPQPGRKPSFASRFDNR